MGSAAGGLIGGGIGAAGSILGGRAQADAAEDAAKTQLKMYRQSRADLAPARGAGQLALSRLANLYGLGGYGDVQTLRGLEDVGGIAGQFTGGYGDVADARAREALIARAQAGDRNAYNSLPNWAQRAIDAGVSIPGVGGAGSTTAAPNFPQATSTQQGQTAGAVPVGMSSNVWNSLTPEQQASITVNGQSAAPATTGTPTAGAVPVGMSPNVWNNLTPEQRASITVNGQPAAPTTGGTPTAAGTPAWGMNGGPLPTGGESKVLAGGTGGVPTAPTGGLEQSAGQRMDTAWQSFLDSPEYRVSTEFTLGEGMRGLSAAQSAAGRLALSPDGSLANSGGLREATRYSQGLGLTTYNDYANRLASLAGIGQSATNTLAGLGPAYAGNIGSAQLQQGAATGAGYVGAANSLSGPVGYGLGQLFGGSSSGSGFAGPGSYDYTGATNAANNFNYTSMTGYF